MAIYKGTVNSTTVPQEKGSRMGLLDLLVGEMQERPERREVKEEKKTADFGKIAMVGLPILLMALNHRNQDEKQAEALTETLSRHESNKSGSLFDRLTQSDEQDGEKILGHILGDKKQDVLDVVAEKAGVSRDEAQKVMAQLSPNVLEQLAEETRGERNVETVRRSTERELEKYQNHNQTFDLQEVITDGISGILKGLMR